ncbi:hypothetical protein [Jannaschia pohangensis]|uniref:Uncharacterized protein n=1 Tax=Jannaschia pohangensis TaxID=390807 RepID=A0A1I3UDA0_9RHOB|nr:hypothetical protein [Jannaschia pohangensis]SFJ80629.1 hypothetical protein SAMN04488095_3715 [Jannaschia pohangensis]
MTYFAKSALLVAALSAPLAFGVSPAIGAESAAQPTLVTTKGDRGGHDDRAQMILASILAESDD